MFHKKITNFIIKFNVLIILGFLGITVFLATFLPKAVLDPNLRNMLPQHTPSRFNLDRMDEMFGGAETIMVILMDDKTVLNTETLQRVKDISKAMEDVEGIDKVMSLSHTNSINGKDGALEVKKLLRRVPKTQKQIDTIRDKIEQNSMLKGMIVTDDYKGTAILGFLSQDAEDDIVAKGVEDVVARYPGQAKAYTGGLPYMRALMGQYMQKDMSKFMPIGFGIMLIFLLLCFRDIRGMLLPAFVVLMSVIVAMGTLVALGWPIQLPIILLPVIMIAIANDYGIHLIARYQYEISLLPDDKANAKDKAVKKEVKREVLEKMLKSLSAPVLAAGLTTIAGFLTLTMHIVESAKHLGLMAGMGVAFALLGSILFIPAVLSLVPLAKKHRIESSQGMVDKMLKGVSGLVCKHPKAIAITSLVITLGFIVGIPRLEVDTSPVSFFSPDSDVVIADNFIDEEFGGSTNLSIVAEGDIKSPEMMKEIDRIEKELDSHEMVGNVISIAQVIRQMNKVLNDDDPAYEVIPDTRDAIAQLLELYSFNGDPDDFEKLVDFDYTTAMITAQYSTPSMKILGTEADFLAEIVQNNPKFTLSGGFGEIISDLAEKLVQGQLISLGLSVLICAIIVALIFKKSIVGIMSIVPIVGAMLMLFGLMGFRNIALSSITTMLTSIMIGAGVDYTIHFLWHYREAKRKGMSKEDAVQNTLMVSGKGIVFNALSVVIGFIALLFSNFLPVQFFGFLITVSISTCLLGALIFLPAAILARKKDIKGLT